MLKPYLVSTDYEQPRPIDGKYPALVHETYAQFEYKGYKGYKGYKVISNHHGHMKASGNPRFVTIHRENIDISWDGSANSASQYENTNESVISYEKRFVATLTALEFGQPHPLTMIVAIEE